MWAHEHKLVKVNFFFWGPAKGHLLQSQVGLLRSILYQILRQCPELIRIACPDLCNPQSLNKLNLATSDAGFLSLEALLAAFQRISTKLEGSRIKFCFFIDGLDEYEGKPADIIRLIELLKESSNIKACVASRPWNEFEATYGKNNPWKLYIHGLTKNDIRTYVQDVLENDIGFGELKESDPKCPDLVKDIVGQAHGVFLWVTLGVRSLLQGLTNADRVADLQSRLQHLPKDLDEYFERIVFTVDEFYRAQTVHMSVIALEAFHTLPLMSYWFIDQEMSEPVLQMDTAPCTMQKNRFRLNQMRTILNALCKGLLEVQYLTASKASTLGSSILFDWRVEFLHRTVRDFLRT